MGWMSAAAYTHSSSSFPSVAILSSLLSKGWTLLFCRRNGRSSSGDGRDQRLVSSSTTKHGTEQKRTLSMCAHALTFDPLCQAGAPDARTDLPGPEQWLLQTWPISTYYYCASTRPRLNFTLIDSLSPSHAKITLAGSGQWSLW
ncbi:unnamed protein product [Leuciscus chuanchicus]